MKTIAALLFLAVPAVFAQNLSILPVIGAPTPTTTTTIESLSQAVSEFDDVYQALTNLNKAAETINFQTKRMKTGLELPAQERDETVLAVAQKKYREAMEVIAKTKEEINFVEIRLYKTSLETALLSEEITGDEYDFGVSVERDTKRAITYSPSADQLKVVKYTEALLGNRSEELPTYNKAKKSVLKRLISKS